jgi:lipopolysaccharide heptosyltransferase I
LASADRLPQRNDAISAIFAAPDGAVPGTYDKDRSMGNAARERSAGPRMADSTSPRRMLIVRPSALGDVCRTVPVLASLRRAYPDAVIDWVVRDTFTGAIAAHPGLTEAIPFPRARFTRWWRPAVAGELRRWLRGLRERRYDLVLDCQGLGRSGLITWATRAPRRIGFRRAREMAWVAYNRRCDVPHGAHTVEAMLALVEAAGVTPVRDTRLYVADDDRAWWTRRRGELDFGDARYAVLAPTARWGSKRWPVERWRSLAVELSKRGFEHLVVIGAPGETDQVRGLAPDGGPAIANLVGATSVGQSMAIVAGSALVVANDSAPLHMAVGLERPCAALFGPTNPAVVGPYGRPEAVVTGGTAPVNYRARSLDDRFMRGIEVDDVLAVIERVIGGTRVGADEAAT